MQADTADYEKGETPMTDYQFQCYKELRDKQEAALRQELELLRNDKPAQSADGMTDYQFKRYEELYNERDALREENAKLREEIERLKKSSQQ